MSDSDQLRGRLATSSSPGRARTYGDQYPEKRTFSSRFRFRASLSSPESKGVVSAMWRSRRSTSCMRVLSSSGSPSGEPPLAPGGAQSRGTRISSMAPTNAAMPSSRSRRVSAAEMTVRVGHEMRTSPRSTSRDANTPTPPAPGVSPRRTQCSHPSRSSHASRDAPRATRPGSAMSPDRATPCTCVVREERGSRQRRGLSDGFRVWDAFFFVLQVIKSCYRTPRGSLTTLWACLPCPPRTRPRRAS